MDYKIDMIGGNCPVQAEGSVGDKKFYFRARGSRWSLSIDPVDPVGDPMWYYSEAYKDGEDFAAGWMSVAEARDFIAKGLKLYEESLKAPSLSPSS